MESSLDNDADADCADGADCADDIDAAYADNDADAANAGAVDDDDNELKRQNKESKLA